MKSGEKFLEKYVNAASPSGYELALGGQNVWTEYVRRYCDDMHVGTYGNAYAYMYGGSGKRQDAYTVLMDAHCDEIGFFVMDITEKGFIKVGRIGGSDVTTTAAARVNVWGDSGVVQGVFGHPAIHVQEYEMTFKIENAFVDVGLMSKADVLATGIRVGTPITMSDGFLDLGEFYCGRSLDDKIGGYITAQVMKRMRNIWFGNAKNPDFNIVAVNAVQEEVGLHGAEMAAVDVMPNLAIVIDVTHDTVSPAYDPKKLGTIVAGEGIVLAEGPSVHKGALGVFKTVAEKEGIPYQMEGFGRSSGTNADAYAYPHGIPTILISIGMRYMHTTVETVHKKDVESAIKLITAVLSNNWAVQELWRCNRGKYKNKL